MAPPDVYAARFLAFVGGRVFCDGAGDGAAGAAAPATLTAPSASDVATDAAGPAASSKPAASSAATPPATPRAKDAKSLLGVVPHGLLQLSPRRDGRSWSLAARR